MKEKNKPDNLEKFFQRVLKDYEEDPGVSFWDRISTEIPEKPAGQTSKPPLYKSWTLLLAFMAGLIVSSLIFYWHSNTRLFSQMEIQLKEKNTWIKKLEKELSLLKTDNQKLLANITEDKEEKENLFLENDSKNQKVSTNQFNQVKPENNIANKSLIKLEIARQQPVVATAPTIESGRLQPFFTSKNYLTGQFQKSWNPWQRNEGIQRLWTDNQLITNSFFVGNSGIFNQTDEKNKNQNVIQSVRPEQKEFGYIEPIPTSKQSNVDFNDFLFLTPKELSKLKINNGGNGLLFDVGDDGNTAFITASINPFSGYKYNLKGYRPSYSSIVESAGITSSWNWSIMGGFETKTKWSVQMGIDFNKLIVAKESINNVRFIAEDAKLISGGYVYSSNQRSDGALGQVIVSTTIFNQQKNDGQDIQDKELFKLSVTTEQPVKIIRVPILGGYRFDLSKRIYVTPKLGFSAVWKTKDQTLLRLANTFSDRLSIQNSAIFLGSSTTVESLEANFRTEFGFRWRPRWYLVAEPRFKYAGKSLFQYKDLELRDSPFHLMFGIRFNVD